MLARCEGEGVKALAPIIDEFNGRFAHIVDPDGRKIELWQPKTSG
jgi:predicted enzyme related to lactoylglutathione lyase